MVIYLSTDCYCNLRPIEDVFLYLLVPSLSSVGCREEYGVFEFKFMWLDWIGLGWRRMDVWDKT